MIRLTEDEVNWIAKHSVAHVPEIRYCSCPCFDALMRIAHENQELLGILIRPTGSDTVTTPLEDSDVVDS